MNKNKYIKSPLNYVGGKHKLLPQIVPLFPKDIRIFVDLFCGGGNVGVNSESDFLVLNDIEIKAIETLEYFYKNQSELIVEKINEIIHKYELSNSSEFGYEYYGCDSNKGLASYNKDKYMKLRDDYNNGENSPVMFYTMLMFAFNNQIRFNSKGEFNMPVNKRDFNNSLKKNLIMFVDKLKELDIKFSNKDFRELKIEKLTNQDFVYIDPPYLITLAAYNENGGWTEKDEHGLYELCDKLHNQGVKFAVSNVTYHKGKQNDILLEWSKKYNIHNLNNSYGNSNYHTKDKSKDGSQEVLITNY